MVVHVLEWRSYTTEFIPQSIRHYHLSPLIQIGMYALAQKVNKNNKNKII